MPGPKATWEEWAKAAKDVAAKVQAPFPVAIDRSGHRFFSLAITQGAKVFDDKGEPAVVDDGFKKAAQLVYRLAQERRDVEGALGLGGGHRLSRRQRRVQERPGRDVRVGLLADRPVRQDHRRRLRLGRCSDPLRPGQLLRHAGRRGARRHQDDAASEGGRAPRGISRQRESRRASSTSARSSCPGHLGLAKQGPRLQGCLAAGQGRAQGLQRQACRSFPRSPTSCRAMSTTA